MADLKPPVPPTPAAAAKGAAKGAKGLGGILKGKPAWMWVAGVTVLVGVAYLVWSRQTPTDELVAEEGDGGGLPEGADVGPVGGAWGYDYSDSGYVTPAPVQGSFGGYDYPPDYFSEPGAAEENADDQPQTINVFYPQPVAGVDAPVAPSGDAVPPTGGGNPPRSVQSHTPPRKDMRGRHKGDRFVIKKAPLSKRKEVRLYESSSGKGDWGKGGRQVIKLAPRRKKKKGRR